MQLHGVGTFHVNSDFNVAQQRIRIRLNDVVGASVVLLEAEVTSVLLYSVEIGRAHV